MSQAFSGKAFDAIIIGAGQAGPSLAGRLTAAGMTVAMIERKLFGGTCVNTGCMPTKTLVASAYAAHLARRGADYGVMLEATPAPASRSICEGWPAARCSRATPGSKHRTRFGSAIRS